MSPRSSQCLVGTIYQPLYEIWTTVYYVRCTTLLRR